jgi:hypothetical protein
LHAALFGTCALAGNCTSLIIEARIKFPAVLGTRGGLRMFPDPQDQPANAPRCEWKDECGKYGKVMPANTPLFAASLSTGAMKSFAIAGLCKAYSTTIECSTLSTAAILNAIS